MNSSAIVDNKLYAGESETTMELIGQGLPRNWVIQCSVCLSHTLSLCIALQKARICIIGWQTCQQSRKMSGDTKDGTLLECSVCKDPFDAVAKQPRLLNCAHSFCGDCLLGLPKSEAKHIK